MRAQREGQDLTRIFSFPPSPDCFWIDADPELRKALPARIERYVIADDVQIEDVTDRLSIFHVLSRAAPDVGDCQRILSARRFAEPGVGHLDRFSVP